MAATATYTERISDTQAGADFTDVVEFYADGETPETAWPLMEVRKLSATRRLASGVSISRQGFQWRAQHRDDSSLTRMFATKGDAVRYARETLN